jgi:hypothetical protein
MTGLVAGIILYFLVSLLTAAIRRKNRGSNHKAAYFGKVVIVCAGGLALVSIGLFVLVVYGSMHGNPTAIWPMYVIFGSGALVMTSAFYDCLVRRIDWAGTDVRFSKWNGTRDIAWADIISLEIKATQEYTRIGFRDGSGFAIVELMTGYDSFVKAAKRKGIKLTEKGKPVKH